VIFSLCAKGALQYVKQSLAYMASTVKEDACSMVVDPKSIRIESGSSVDSLSPPTVTYHGLIQDGPAVQPPRLALNLNGVVLPEVVFTPIVRPRCPLRKPGACICSEGALAALMNYTTRDTEWELPVDIDDNGQVHIGDPITPAITSKRQLNSEYLTASLRKLLRGIYI